MLGQKTTQRELAQVFGIAQAMISKGLYNVPFERANFGREQVYDTAVALRAMRTWFMRRRAYFLERSEKLAAQAAMASDELRRLEKGGRGDGRQ